MAPVPARLKEEAETLTRLLHARTSHVVHLTHNDLDAVGSDAIHRMKFGDVITLWSSVGKYPYYLDQIAGVPGNGDLISISDLGFQKGAEQPLRRAKKNGWRLEWRDHHRWQDEEIVLVTGLANLLHVDVTICACGICALDLQPENPVAGEVARVVCDYDLWLNRDPRATVLGQVLQRKKNREHVRDCLIDGMFSDDFIEREYRDIRKEMNAMMEKSLRHAVIRKGKYRIVFAPLYGYPSETAAYIREREGSEIEVIISPGGRFSLRSVPPISHVIAREFQGGGHPHAAGGTFPFSFWDRLAFLLFRRSRYFDHFVSVAESSA
jgi:oligoribonuclease NrnB/cAMP/cGMP phosphodiesterase (DHH superfamily)